VELNAFGAALNGGLLPTGEAAKKGRVDGNTLKDLYIATARKRCGELERRVRRIQGRITDGGGIKA